MRAGHRGVDVEVLRPLGRAPRAVLVLIGQQKIDAAADGLVDRLPRWRLHGLGPRRDFVEWLLLRSFVVGQRETGREQQR